MVVTYPLLTVTDDAGAVVPTATVAITSVKDKAGADIGTPGATLNQSGANISVDYDAEAKGEAWIVLAVSAGGHTFTGLNAAPAFFLAKDPSRILTALPNAAVGAAGGLPRVQDLPAAPDNATIAAIAIYVDTEVAAIKAKTDNLPASPAAVGSAMTLASNGLDAISMAEPATGPPTNYREWTLWLIRRIAQATKAFAGNSGTIKTKKTSGADWTTQAITDDGAGNETVGPPT